MATSCATALSDGADASVTSPRWLDRSLRRGERCLRPNVLGGNGGGVALPLGGIGGGNGLLRATELSCAERRFRKSLDLDRSRGEKDATSLGATPDASGKRL